MGWMKLSELIPVLCKKRHLDLFAAARLLIEFSLKLKNERKQLLLNSLRNVFRINFRVGKVLAKELCFVCSSK